MNDEERTPTRHHASTSEDHAEAPGQDQQVGTIEHEWLLPFEDTPRTGRVRGVLSALKTFLQEHVGPHLQLSPQAQPAAWLFALAFWQPQSQAAPGQATQLQAFVLVVILSFSLICFVDMSSTTEVSH